MIIEIIIFIFLGTFFGTISGILPGVHSNLLATGILYLTNYIKINPIYALTFIVSIGITHTFVDFIPSVFLSCPSQEKSLLPGHELLNQGRGNQAVFLSTLGSIFGIFLVIIISPILIYTFPKINLLLKNKIEYILIIILLSSIFKEKQKLKTILVILITGTLGTLVLNLNIKDPLLPLLTGLFATPLIIESIKNKVEIPKQDEGIEIPKRIKKSILLSTFSSLICGFLPGVGISQSATIATSFSKTEREEFIFILGTINTMILTLSFIVLYTISKTRTGIASAIKELFPNISIKILIFILALSVISGIISFFITIFLSNKFSKIITKINYKKISIFILIFVFLLNLIIVKFKGIIILISATIIGIYSNSLEIKKTNMMSCILIPTIIFYLFNN
jgi:putative membrane protein